MKPLSTNTAPSHGTEVLIVDDDPDVLFVLARRLKEAGFVPLLACDGTEALVRIAEHPNCRRMLTDYCMPGLSGDDWLDMVRAECTDWSVVVMSVLDVDPGPFVIAPKPLDIENILQCFERVRPPAATSSRSQRQLRRSAS